jgi:membrane fusion protein (multidrug efflux system)
MLMKVLLIRSKETVKVVPEEALIPVGSKQYVFRVDADNKVDRVAVEIGRRRPGSVEIISGVALDTLVVTEGVIRVRSGTRVKFKNKLIAADG